jgi:hypothetical protein
MGGRKAAAKDMTDEIADILTKKMQASSAPPEEVKEPEKLEVKKEDDTPLFYAKKFPNGTFICQTSMLTEDAEAFKDWVRFTHPLLGIYPKDLDMMVLNMDARRQLVYIMENGIGIAFRDPNKTSMTINTYKGKGH